jgi:leader peptidase (prepilin peptidase) / N-methyltransferase
VRKAARQIRCFDRGDGNILKENLYPDLATFVGVGGAIAIMSALMLPWQTAVASTVLGGLMIVGAGVDARTFLLPDVVTWGALGCGVIAAAALHPSDQWYAIAAAIGRAAGTALALVLVRWCYARLRMREGLGFGDVKLAAAVGAWLPLENIPLCFGLASGGALIAVMLARLRGETVDASTKVPFGAFLCPALWLVFYGASLSS